MLKKLTKYIIFYFYNAKDSYNIIITYFFPIFRFFINIPPLIFGIFNKRSESMCTYNKHANARLGHLLKNLNYANTININKLCNNM